jgi:outer membrane immunogenic protein
VAPLAVYNWAGHVGGAWTNQEWVNTANAIPGGTFGDLSTGEGFHQRGTGIFVGGHTGYDWQASNFVFGLERTISGLDTRGSNTCSGVQASRGLFRLRRSGNRGLRLLPNP